MKRFYTVLFIAILFTQLKLQGQGCVAIRSNGSTCALGKPGEAKGWQFSFNTRYFKSYKHFVGKEEQKERVENGTEVINHSFSWDFTFTKALNNRWSVAVDVPLLSFVRSSMYEHYGNNNASKIGARRNTESFGVGDIRVAAYRWLLNPEKSHKGNIQAGLGIKLPTGNYEYQDYFHKLAANGSDSTVLGPVDQSIQLGDGGTGFTLELNGFYNFTPAISVYGNFYYLANPREQNGVSTGRGGSVNATAIKYFTSTMSVPDQYMMRAGVNVGLDALVEHLSFSGGIRTEAVPSSDLFGGDRGFRRPGIVTSAEPTLSYMTKSGIFYVSVPVAISRNRTQSYSDKLRTADTGTKVQGDAAFADYLVNVGFSVRL
jgi:hypothetical protein